MSTTTLGIIFIGSVAMGFVVSRVVRVIGGVLRKHWPKEGRRGRKHADLASKSEDPQ